ncbi:hypothetical protein ACFL42_00265 [Candidatus Omnitrophota bacterium]
MKKIELRAVIGVLLLTLFAAVNCHAQGNAAVYRVTVQSIDLLKPDGTWENLGTPNQAIDIASANAGAVAGSLVSKPIPPGSYVNFRIILSNVIVFSGIDAVAAGGPHYTSAGGTVALNGLAATANSTATWPANPPTGVVGLAEGVETRTIVAAAQGTVTATLNLGIFGGRNDGTIHIQGATNLGTPVLVGPNSAVTMSFAFDVNNTVHSSTPLGGDEMFFIPPQTGTLFEITVDGQTMRFTRNQMVLTW